MIVAQNDNGPNPAASVTHVRLDAHFLVLGGQPGTFHLIQPLFRQRALKPIAVQPHPFPEIFGYRGPAQPAPSPTQSTTRKARPAFIRGVIERSA